MPFRDVLRNPTALSYFMEFMDRRHRSLLVQFWLTVESFKNPLESIDSCSEEEGDSVQNTSSPTTLREDVSMINDLYFSANPPHPCLSSISRRHIETIQSYAIQEATLSNTENKKVRRGVMLSQREVEQDMEQDFEDFQKSEFWFRVLEDFSFSDDARISRPSGSVHESRPASRRPPLARSSVARMRLPRSESSPSLVTVSNSADPESGSLDAAPSKVAPAISSPPVPRSNIDVLMSPVTDSSSDISRAPLFDDPSDEGLDADEPERMRAIQAALIDIIATDQQISVPFKQGESSKDRLSSSLQDLRSQRALFEEDEYANADEEEADESTENSPDHAKGSFRVAGPGDLQLFYEISRLASKINSLETHATMIDTLVKKAELTGDTQELRLLQNAKLSMTREIRQLQFQKTQYEQQEAANRLAPERTRISIGNSTVGEEDGKPVVRYLVEVKQLAVDDTFASDWVVARRYNEFLLMHTKLREKYSIVRGLDFPGKRLVTPLSGNFVDTRRQALEKYMQVMSVTVDVFIPRLRGWTRT